MRKTWISNRTRQLTAGIITTLAVSLFAFAGTASAWSPPSLTSLCAPDSSHFAWKITLANESNFMIDTSWNSSFSGATTMDFASAGVHNFTTLRPAGGTTLFVRWSSDHNSTGSAAANTEVCASANKVTPTPTPTPTPTVESVASTPQTVTVTVPTSAAPIVAGFQVPPVKAIGAVTPIVLTPGSNQLPPSTVQAVQRAPVAGVQSLPSTSTNSSPALPLTALGLAMMAIGGLLLRRRGSQA